ncbi:Rho GTPase-activating protein [Striga asiatica]|uniref:Rho GTPase-activating protein n=1 Tax=Striga asiatica TaxID=4170 RepID=A0A5A7QC07_STRAF|nr:Rho GTPase-activating protein [Striga asiatica]
MGHNGIFRNDTNDSIEGSFNQWRERRPVKSLVVGRPIFLALEDIDGGPSFLEKALRFLEKDGIKVEGILRQSADIEEVERRVQEYEQGKAEFDPIEDAHVIGDCIKSMFYVSMMGFWVTRSFVAVFEKRSTKGKLGVLKMMHTVSSHASENRMTPSAVAACMAPLLLRPLLAGECELVDDFDINEDHSSQLLAAANAANSAQAIVTTLLEDDDESPDIEVNGYHDAQNEADHETDFECDRMHSGKLSESSGSAASDLYDYKAIGNDDSDDGSRSIETKSNPTVDLDQLRVREKNTISASEDVLRNEAQRSMGEILSSMIQEPHQPVTESDLLTEKAIPKPTNMSNGSAKRLTFWGKKNAIDSSGEEELAIQRLEVAKNDLRHRIAKEARKRKCKFAS